jgi:hypothetical protein
MKIDTKTNMDSSHEFWNQKVLVEFKMHKRANDLKLLGHEIERALYG